MLGVIDAIIKGVETGVLCKQLDQVENKYISPTADEIRKYIGNSSYRLGINIDEARNKYNLAPSGRQLTDPSENDRQWLQNCEKSLTDSEIEEITRAVMEKVQVI